MNIGKNSIIALTFSASALLLGTGCKDKTQAAVCDNCGVVSSIDQQDIEGEPSAAGAIAGAIVGGVLGHQVDDSDAGTAVGAVGGAVVGSEISRQQNASTVYVVHIDMENGETRSMTVPQIHGLSLGSEVKVEGNKIRAI